MTTGPSESPVAGAEGRVDLSGGLVLRWEANGEGLDVGVDGPGTPSDASLVVDALDRLAADPGAAGPLRLVADHPASGTDPFLEEVAVRLGLSVHRDLLQLRRPLPVAADDPVRLAGPGVATRPVDLRAFLADPGSPTDRDDAGAWLRANNRAFAAHPDQGSETAASLRRKVDAEATDPSGFLVADDPDRPGELAGFCWTKTWPPTGDDPALGEIYVIGVDPHHWGRHLGRPLVLAGLDHLAGRGLATAMLYVDADNGPARRLYDRLGFAVHRRRRLSSAP